MRVTENAIKKKFRPRKLFGRPVIKRIQGEEVCQIIRIIHQQVPKGWNGVPIAGNVDLRFYVFVTRHVLWEEGKKEEVRGRCGTKKFRLSSGGWGRGEFSSLRGSLSSSSG